MVVAEALGARVVPPDPAGIIEQLHAVTGAARLDPWGGLPVLHPGPINRGVEIAHDLADRRPSVILDQVRNGVAVRMAVLYQFAGRKSREG